MAKGTPVFCEHDDYVEVRPSGDRWRRCRNCSAVTIIARDVDGEPAALPPWTVA